MPVTPKAQTDAAFADMERKVLEGVRVTIMAFALRAYTDVQIDTRLPKSDGGAHGSPVKTGRFAASHRIGLNSVDGSTATPVTPYPKKDIEPDKRPIANPPLSDAQGVLRQYKFGDTIIISNSVQYAADLEAGASRKAPGGVYAPSLAWTKARYGAAIEALDADVNINIREL